MLNFTTATKIFLACEKTDMRKGMGSLSALTQENPVSQLSDGSVFAFRGKRADRIKILFWDGQGYCLFSKRLERGKFFWPSSESKAWIRLTGAQLSMLMEGVDWRNPQWSAPPSVIA